MHLSIHHVTAFDYPLPVTNSINEVWLRPITDGRQSCLSFSLSTEPRAETRSYIDYFGNTVYHFDIPQPHARLEILARAEVETRPIDLDAVIAADYSPYALLQAVEQDRWVDFLSPTALTVAGPAVRDLVASVAIAGRSVGAIVRDLAARVTAGIRYQGGVTSVTTTAEEALQLGAGVCQDHTHAFLAACRQLGIPARYVSGYLCTGAGEDEEQASHAWPEALLPRAGWVGLDVANGKLVDEHYVAAAIGRDYADVPPVRGAYHGPEGSGLDVAVFVLKEPAAPKRPPRLPQQQGLIGDQQRQAQQ